MSGCVRLLYSVPTNSLADPCLLGGVEAKVATLAFDDDSVPADTHGVAYSRQTIHQRSDLFVGENEGLGSAPPNGAEFLQGLIIACRVITDRHVLGLVFVNEEHATQQDPLGIEGRIGGPVGTDVGSGGQLLHLPLLT